MLSLVGLLAIKWWEKMRLDDWELIVYICLYCCVSTVRWRSLKLHLILTRLPGCVNCFWRCYFRRVVVHHHQAQWEHKLWWTIMNILKLTRNIWYLKPPLYLPTFSDPFATNIHFWHGVPDKDIGYKVRMSYRRPRDALRGLDLEKDKGRDWKESDDGL